MRFICSFIALKRIATVACRISMQPSSPSESRGGLTTLRKVIPSLRDSSVVLCESRGSPPNAVAPRVCALWPSIVSRSWDTTGLHLGRWLIQVSRCGMNRNFPSIRLKALQHVAIRCVYSTVTTRFTTVPQQKPGLRPITKRSTTLNGIAPRTPAYRGQVRYKKQDRYK